jgi:hypothetical protein
LKDRSFQNSFSCLILFSFSGRPESGNSCRRNAGINNDRREPRNNHPGLYRSGRLRGRVREEQSRWQTGLFEVSAFRRRKKSSNRAVVEKLAQMKRERPALVNPTISNLIILIYLLGRVFLKYGPSYNSVPLL